MSANATSHIRLAVFRSCSCSSFEPSSFEHRQHLAVETKEVELKKENAVAISYTWGEFDRQKRCIGHWSDDSSSEVSLILGTEWSVADLISRLAQLTTMHNACWIDQLCLPQKDDEIMRQLLASMPIIYRTLAVVIVLPGSPCSCLRNAYNDHLNDTNPEIDDTFPDEEKLSKTGMKVLGALHGNECLNSNGQCSWLNRLWPLQELRVCSQVRLLWASDQEAPCCRPLEALKRSEPESCLGKNSQLYFQQLREEYGFTPARSMLETLQRSIRFFEPLQRLMRIIAMRNSTRPQITVALARLILGETLNFDSKDEKVGYEDLLKALFLAERINSSVTKPRDYVLSVWTDWSGYEIPQNYTELSAQELLHDAFGQLYQQTTIFIPSLFPAGLMGANTSTASWFVEEEPDAIRNTIDLYGTFDFSSALQVLDLGRLPLKCVDPMPKSLSYESKLFHEWIHNMDKVEAIRQFIRIMKAWSPRFWYTFSKFQSVYLFERLPTMLRGDPADQIQALKSIISEYSIDPASDKLDTWTSFLVPVTNQVLERAFLELVAESMHMNVAACRRSYSELKLVFTSPRENKTWGEGGSRGMTTIMEPCVGVVNWRKLDEARQRDEVTLTIGLKEIPRSPVYEAVRIESEDCGYAIFGVWAQVNENAQFAEVGAVLTDEGPPDAFIV